MFGMSENKKGFQFKISAFWPVFSINFEMFPSKSHPQTRHTIEKVFTPLGLPGVPFSIEEEVFDFALIKLGNVT